MTDATPVRDRSTERLAMLATAFAAGVVLGEQVRPPPAVALTVVGVAAVLAALRWTAVRAVLLAVALGACLTGLRLASLDRSALREGALRSADAVLEGELLADPIVDRDATRVVVGVRRAEIDGAPRRVRERVLLTIRPAGHRRLQGGTVVRVDGRLRPLAPPGEDAADAVRALERRGVAARAFAGPDDVHVIGRSRRPLSVVAEAGRAAVRRAAAHVPAADRGLLLGVTIGDVALLQPEVDLDFRITGLSHLVAVSGANVAMVLAVVLACARLCRAGPRLTITLLALTVVAFMAITRFEPSVLRAGVMASVALMAVAVGARRRAMTVLAASVLVLLAIDPFLVYSLGFQLSVLATLGILAIAPRLAERMPDHPLWSALAITAGAQLAVAPLLVLRFGQLSIVSLAANLVVGPAVGPATVIGMVAAGLGAIWHPLARLAALTVPFIRFMRMIAHAMAEVPLASIALGGAATPALLALVLGALAFVMARSADRRVGALLLIAALLAGSGAVLRARAELHPRDGLVVTMLDVGQGDALVVRCGDGAMLVDGGPDPRTIVRDLRAIGVRRVDLLVTTHPHQDHVAGLVPVARQLPVARALDPAIDDDLPSYRALVAALSAEQVPRDRAVAGAAYDVGCARVEVLWPPPRLLEGTESDVNNNSVVLRVRYGRQVVLLAGETQEEAQQELLRRPELLRADVLKVSHHGSARMEPAFYAATRARLALIPVGPNTFGHPAPATLIALRGMGILRSDEDGTVSVGFDGDSDIRVTTAR